MSNRFTKGKALFATLQTSGDVTVGGTLSATSGIRPASGLTMGAIARGTIALDPASINAQVKGTTTVAVAGASAKDLYFFEPPATLETGLVYAGYVPLAGSVSVILGNLGTAAVNGGSIDWGYTRIPLA